MEIWNTKVLPAPPINTCKVKLRESDYRLLSITIQEAIEFFQNQQILHKEAAVLSRCIYRMKMKFRNSKDLKSMEKLNKSLLNYNQMNLPSNLINIKNLIPLQYKSQMYLPTKNMIDHILVRLQGLAKLIIRILDTSKLTALQIQKKIYIGHFWNIYMIFYAIISRIFVLKKDMLKYICGLYQNLIPFSKKLRNTGPNWLDKKYEFPTNLADWLEINWITLDNIVEIPDEQPMRSFLDLAEDSDDSVEICDEYIIIKDNSDDEIDQFSTHLEGFEPDDEIGEIIEISDGSILESKIRRKSPKKRFSKKRQKYKNSKRRSSFGQFDKI